jgi:hypothetical protein
MAGRTLSRRALRDEYDQAEAAEADAPDADDAEEAPKAKKPRAKKAAAAKAPRAPKAPAKPRVRKKTTKAAPRMFAKWAVCDGGLKRVAVFDYRDRAGADARLAEYRERKTGTYFLQLVKDPYEPPPAAV